MKITKIRINNFKNIKDEISLQAKDVAGKSCFDLLGINENIKSNILEAVSMLNSGQTMDYETYCNKQAQESAGTISIHLDLKSDEHDNYKERLIKLGVEKELANIIKIEKIEKRLFIKTTGSEDTHFYKIGNAEFEKYVFVTSHEGMKLVTRTLENYKKEDYCDDTNVLDKKWIQNYMCYNHDNMFKSHPPKIILCQTSEKINQ